MCAIVVAGAKYSITFFFQFSYPAKYYTHFNVRFNILSIVSLLIKVDSISLLLILMWLWQYSQPFLMVYNIILDHITCILISKIKQNWKQNIVLGLKKGKLKKETFTSTSKSQLQSMSWCVPLKAQEWWVIDSASWNDYMMW